MDKQVPLEGRLLRMERLRQNRGQKEICYGICVPSYLSKIEHGQAVPEAGILARLFARLEIAYETDEVTLEELRRQTAEYFRRMEYQLDTGIVYASLKEREKALEYSALAIDWMLIKGVEEGSLPPFLSELMESMDSRQLAYYYILYFWEKPQDKVRFSLCKKYCEALGSSFAMNKLCNACLWQGDYTAVHQMESRITALALAEGNTFQLAEYYLIKGSAYSCLNLEELMMACYQRSICLLQNTKWEDLQAILYYNMGSSYISLEKYDLALEYLDKAEKTEDKHLIFHKKAIALIRSGQKELGAEFLEKMKEQLVSSGNASRADVLRYEEAVMECEDNYLDSPQYLELLEELIKAMKAEYHFGHLYFYHDVMVQACTRQRKYKRALEFEREISREVTKKSF